MPKTFEVVRKIPHIMRSTPDFLLEMAAKYGDNVSFLLPDEKARFINHPALIQYVLQTNYRNYSKETPQFQTFSLVTGNGLLNSDGDFWLRQRRIVQPAFHQRQLDTLVGIMCEEAVCLRQRWAAQVAARQPVSIEQEMLKVALRIIMRALFSVDVSDKTADLVHLTEEVLGYVIFRAQTLVELPFAPLLPVHRRFRQALSQLDRFVYDLIERRREDELHNDVLSLLLAAQDESGEPLPDKVIRDEVLTLIIAGYETAATGLTWAWYLLSQHADAAARLHAELDRVLGGRTPTLADLPSLAYTSQVLKESWRLYPPSWLISRTAVADDVLGGDPIAAGRYVIISPYTMHRHPEFWPRPEHFDPCRFTPEQEKTRPRFAYIPFGGGPRLCIGNRFAEMESVVILATLAQHFAPVPVEQPLPRAQVTIRPHNGMLMRITEKP